MVTIVFLPMSFLSSLFALDITSLPHRGDNLSYPPRWIFPRIFGSTAAIAVPLVILAFYVNDAIGMWKLWKQRQLKRWKSPTKYPKPHQGVPEHDSSSASGAQIKGTISTLVGTSMMAAIGAGKKIRHDVHSPSLPGRLHKRLSKVIQRPKKRSYDQEEQLHGSEINARKEEV